MQLYSELRTKFYTLSYRYLATRFRGGILESTSVDLDWKTSIQRFPQSKQLAVDALFADLKLVFAYHLLARIHSYKTMILDRFRFNLVCEITGTFRQLNLSGKPKLTQVWVKPNATFYRFGLLTSILFQSFPTSKLEVSRLEYRIHANQ